MHMTLGSGLNAFCGYAIANWNAPFLIRSYQMPAGEAGAWLAAIIGLGDAISVFASGLPGALCLAHSTRATKRATFAFYLMR